MLPANPPSAAPLDLDAKAEAIGPDDPRWMECLIDFAEQSEDRLAELALRLPHGDFDEADVSMVDEARFALTQLVAAARRGVEDTDDVELVCGAAAIYAEYTEQDEDRAAEIRRAIAHLLACADPMCNCGTPLSEHHDTGRGRRYCTDPNSTAHGDEPPSFVARVSHPTAPGDSDAR